MRTVFYLLQVKNTKNPHNCDIGVAKMVSLLPQLSTKAEIDDVIRMTEDIIVVLRFGKLNDPECLKIDDLVFNMLAIIVLNCA